MALALILLLARPAAARAPRRLQARPAVPGRRPLVLPGVRPRLRPGRRRFVVRRAVPRPATANGERFDRQSVSAAHPTLPLPSLVRVVNLTNHRELVVRVNDRGPFVADRLIDLSQEAARQLGFERQGLAQVRVQFVRLADADGAPPRPTTRRSGRRCPSDRPPRRRSWSQPCRPRRPSGPRCPARRSRADTRSRRRRRTP